MARQHDGWMDASRELMIFAAQYPKKEEDFQKFPPFPFYRKDGILSSALGGAGSAAEAHRGRIEQDDPRIK